MVALPWQSQCQSTEKKSNSRPGICCSNTHQDWPVATANGPGEDRPFNSNRQPVHIALCWYMRGALDDPARPALGGAAEDHP